MSDELLSPEELAKQRGELEAWLRFARDKGEGFMRGGLPDPEAFADYRDKVVVDVGCGPRPFVERFPVRLPIMVDCCMLSYAEAGLLQPSTLENAVLIDAMAEALPFRSGSVDIVFALNMLDHCYRPDRVVQEFRRILRLGGMLHIHVDVGGEPNICEPVVFTESRLEEILFGFELVEREEGSASNPGREKTLRGVLAKNRPAGDEEDVSGRTLDDIIQAPDGEALRRESDTILLGRRSGRRYQRRGAVWDFRPQD